VEDDVSEPLVSMDLGPPGPVTPVQDSATARRQRDMARAVLENTSALICLLDAEGRFTLVNRACEELLGWSQEELLGRAIWETVVVPAERHLARQGVALALEHRARGSVAEGVWLDRLGGEHVLRWNNTVLYDEHGTAERIACVGIDVTDQRRAEAQLRRYAETDLLTGLGNRRSLFEAMSRALEPTAQGCGLLYCDLDGFKAVNDRLGHLAGDQLLVAAGERMRTAVRSGDLVARIGGDEFVVLCPGAGPAALARLAERLRAAVGAPYELPTGTAEVGVSIGSALAPAGSTPDEVLLRADHAMYAAKRAARR